MRRFSILLVVIFLTFFPAYAENSRLLWSKATGWGMVRVRQSGDARILMFADGDGETEESRMLVSRPNELQERYLRQMVLLLSSSGPRAHPPKWLVVGMGAGSLSRELRRVYPASTVTSVELEPVVVEAARKFFLYKDSARMITVIDDARHFLETSSETYDGIFLDAFDGVEVPAPLRTVEFARLLDRHLAENGVVVANIHFVPQVASLRYQRSLADVFSHHYVADGLAQGVGIYARREVAPSAAAIQEPVHGHLLKAAPPADLNGIEPYRDGAP